MSSWLYTVVAVSPRVELRPYPDAYVDFVAKATKLRIEHPTEVVSLGSWFDGWGDTFQWIGLPLADADKVLLWDRGRIDYEVYALTPAAALRLAKLGARKRKAQQPNLYATNAMIPTLKAAAAFAELCKGDVLIAVRIIGVTLGDDELGEGYLPNAHFRPVHRRTSR